MSSAPIRTCLVCRKKTTKDQLIRWVKREDSLHLDKKKHIQAKGYYCHKGECEQNMEKINAKGLK